MFELRDGPIIIYFLKGFLWIISARVTSDSSTKSLLSVWISVGRMVFGNTLEKWSREQYVLFYTLGYDRIHRAIEEIQKIETVSKHNIHFIPYISSFGFFVDSFIVRSTASFSQSEKTKDTPPFPGTSLPICWHKMTSSITPCSLPKKNWAWMLPMAHSLAYVQFSIFFNQLLSNLVNEISGVLLSEVLLQCVSSCHFNSEKYIYSWMFYAS